MNLLGTREQKETRMELKYCERCGGLWLRARGSEVVHCASCRLRLAALTGAAGTPRSSAADRNPRLPGCVSAPKKRPAPARIDRLRGVAVMEVRA